MEDSRALHTMIAESVGQHMKTCEEFFAEYDTTLAALAIQVKFCFDAGGKLLICGNGGSTCDAMHIAGEFVGRFKEERRGLPAIALTADSGILTAVGNDYGFDEIFARQVQAIGNAGDMLIGLSTSGSSPNILRAFEQARKQEVATILFTGEKGRTQAEKVHSLFCVPSTDTAHIQEVYMIALHLLAQLVESQIIE